MTDSTTAVANAAQGLLAPGERVLAGLAAHPAHEAPVSPGVDSAIVRTGIGGLVMGELIDSYRAGARPLTGEAAEVPAQFHFWIGLTSQRLLFFEGGLIARVGARLAPEGSPGPLYSAIALADVLAIEARDAHGHDRLELRFADDSHASVTCAHAGEGSAFCAAFEQAREALAS